jgi:hypothetical protein
MSYDLVYTYCADIHCSDCGQNIIEDRLQEYWEVMAGIYGCKGMSFCEAHSCDLDAPLCSEPVASGCHFMQARLQRQYKQNSASQVPEADCRYCGHSFIPTVKAWRERRCDWIECPECGQQVAAFDEYTFDSDDFPKGFSGSSESDSPQHCATCGEFLENDLTSDGDAYVLENCADNEEYRQFYSYLDWPSEDDDEDDEVLQD